MVMRQHNVWCMCVTFCVGRYVELQSNIPPHTELQSNIPPHTELQSNIPPHTELQSNIRTEKCIELRGECVE